MTPHRPEGITLIKKSLQ